MASLPRDDAVQYGAQFAAPTQSSRPGTAGDGRHSADSLATPAVVSTVTAPSGTFDLSDMVHILDFSSTDLRPTGKLFPVEKLTTSSDALKKMEDLRLSGNGSKGKGSADQTSEAHRFRWIHFPDTNVRWAQDALPKIRAHLDELVGSGDDTVRQSGFYTEDFFDARSNAFKTGRLHARFMKPFAHTWTDQNKARTELVLMMPFLHWEAKEDYDKMRQCVEFVEGSSLPHALPAPQAQYYNLLEQSDQDIHIRRSLDQSYYWSLPDTKRRDNDQVVTRYDHEPRFRSHTRTALQAPAPLLMVDQLWLWVFNGDQNNSTVVSFFPRTWGESHKEANNALRKDPLDVFSLILEFFLKSPRAQKCTSSMKLAFHIIDRCAGNVVDEKLTHRGDQQYIEHFNHYIDGLMDDHKAFLEDFETKMKAAEAHNKQLAAGAVADDDQISPSFEISLEIAILKDVRDIEEELLMMRHVVEDQQHALVLLQHQYRRYDPERSDDDISWDGMTHTAITLPSLVAERRESKALGWEPNTEVPGFPSDAGLSVPTIMVSSSIEPATELPDIQVSRAQFRESANSVPSMKSANSDTKVSDARPKQAAVTEKSTLRLLDIKQRHQQTSIAVEQRRLARAAEQQGEAIMLFTIVTIVFLPLTSVASIYGMNAKEFGQGEVRLTHIFRIMFPVSASVAIGILYLAFHERFRRVLTLLIAYIWLSCTQWLFDISLRGLEDWLQEAVGHLMVKKKDKGKAVAKRSNKATKAREKQEQRNSATGSTNANKTNSDNVSDANTDVRNGPSSPSALPPTGGRKERTPTGDKARATTSRRRSKRSARQSADPARSSTSDVEAQRRTA